MHLLRKSSFRDSEFEVLLSLGRQNDKVASKESSLFALRGNL